jgi:fructuronate reductase/mannitol 2-dehydrogenase
VPAYDRAKLRSGFVHFGVGGFHRAHQAMYLDDLARLGHTGWGEIGIGLRSAAMRDALLPQDCLFTVVSRGAEDDAARAVGSMIGYRYAPDDPAAVLGVLADPRTRIVTLTITGGGYPVDSAGAFRDDHPAVLADLANPSAPATVHGYLVAALDRRRRAGLPAFTVLSCDNVPDNGAVTRATVVGFARLRDRGLADWIDAQACFPASMVDRITPETDDRARLLVARRFGVRDRWPVVTESFTQWIVQDTFCAGRPPLQDVGVQFVSDVAPYKTMKTRLLNASHSALGYLGLLSGQYRTTNEAMSNPLLVDYLAALMGREIAPSLPPVPGIDVAAYQRTLLHRFANPRIGDQLARLCGQGSTKMPAYLLPSLIQARERGQRAPLLTLAVAAWIGYLRGHDATGAPIEVKDTRRDTLQPLAITARHDPRPLLAVRSIFGPLGDDPEFVTALNWASRDLETYGPVGAIRNHLAAELPVAA